MMLHVLEQQGAVRVRADRTDDGGRHKPGISEALCEIVEPSAAWEGLQIELNRLVRDHGADKLRNVSNCLPRPKCA